MEAIREIRKITDHKITIEIPESFKNKNVEIIVLPLDTNKAIKCESALLSEAVLAQDWNKSEEESAWADL